MTDQPTPAIAPINSMEQFARLLYDWHQNGMLQLDHLFNIPPGEVVSVSLEVDAPEEDITLEGDLLKGFRIGMVVAMNLLGDLPFSAQTANTPTEDAAASDN